MGAQEFLHRVEQTGMVSQPLLNELRMRVADSKRELRSEVLAKLLVDRGELTPAQARKLVALADDDASPGTAQPAEPREPEAGKDEELRENESAGHAAPDQEEELLLLEDDEELTLLEDEAKGPGNRALEDEQELDLLLDDTEPEAILSEDDPHKLPEAELDLPDAAPAPPLALDASEELDDILGDPVAATAEERAGGRLRRRRRGLKGIWNELFGKKRPEKNRWDSPLILLGGGALILLLLAGIGFLVLFRSESSEELFQTAEEAYRSRSYSQARARYDEFAARYPNDERASLARVRIELAKLRQLTEGTKDWEAAARAARENLPGIVHESAFPEARLELAGLLPDITSALVDQARAAPDTNVKQASIDQAVRSLELVNNSVYLPTSIRQSREARIEEIETDIQVVLRNIERDRQLRTTVSEIQTAAEAGHITQAYSLRDRLVNSYPILGDHPRLNRVLSEITSQEAAAVRLMPGVRKAVTEDHPSPAAANVILSDQRGQLAEGIESHLLGVLLSGAVYGIDASRGDVLWRRFVGYETDVVPQALGIRPRSDFLLVDARRGEVLRVEAATGKLVWRLACPQPIAPVRILPDSALIACGKQAESMLLQVDLDTGTERRQVHFPIGCTSMPAVNHARQEVIQLGTHSSVYVLDANSLKCKSVLPLGHSRESVSVGPVTVGHFLLVCENDGAEASRLHVFSAGEEGTWVRAGEPLRMQGQVLAPPSVDQQRVLVMTDLGEMRIFEAPSEVGSLREIAYSPPGNGSSGRAFALLERSNLWLGQMALTRFELQATRGQLIPKWVRHADDRFLGPIQRKGSYLFQLRRRAGMLGATISAARIATSAEDGQTVWETDIGVPCSIVASDPRVHAVTANGALFPIDRSAVRSGTTNQRAARIDARLLPKALTQQVSISKDQFVFAGPPPVNQMVLADLSAQELKLVPLGVDEITAELVNINEGILAASEAGPIQLLDLSSGTPRMSPFLPRIEPGTRIDWLRPAPLDPAASDEAPQFVAAERSGRFYRVGIDTKREMLKLLAENDLGRQLAGGLTSNGSAVYAVLQGEAGADIVTVIESQGLKVSSETPLGDGLAWGPMRVGGSVLVADASGTVFCFDAAGDVQWKATGLGPLAGPPAAMNDGKSEFIFASQSGRLTVVDARGQVQAKKELAEPLGGGPVAYGGRLLVAGWDGTVYLTDIPR